MLKTRPVDLLLMVIFAPGTTAPVGSVTVPWMLPVEIVVWAQSREALRRRTRVAKAADRIKEYCNGLRGLMLGSPWDVGEQY